MDQADSTCWTVLRSAAAGGAGDSRRVRRRYAPAGPRLPRGPLAGLAPAPGPGRRGPGRLRRVPPARRVLERVPADQPGGLPGVPLRGRAERRPASRAGSGRAAWDTSPPRARTRGRSRAARRRLSRVFDRAWARAVMREAAARQAERAEARGGGRNSARRTAPPAVPGGDADPGDRPALGRRPARRCTTSTPGHARSSGRPCSRSWPSITPARPGRPRANARNCSHCWGDGLARLPVEAPGAKWTRGRREPGGNRPREQER